MTRDAALKMMSEVVEGLRRSGMAEPGAPVTENTVLIGAGSILDSVGFVTFIAEIEDRLSSERDEPVELILTEIWEFNAENPSLTAKILADFCASLVLKRE
jgi:hypothetical protein